MDSVTTRTMFSSASDDWATPQDLFDKLNAEFRLTLDVCASYLNRKCFNYFDLEQDGLRQDWTQRRLYDDGAIWMNPPYGRGIGAWVKKARETAVAGRLVVCLLPARTDTAWWQDHVIGGGAEVRFIRGRLKFGGHKNSAPFPSAVVVFRP